MPRFAPSKGFASNGVGEALHTDTNTTTTAGPSSSISATAATSTPQGIKSISKSDIHRITSGQVVLDLQSAVKEVVENALDAGSTSIEIRFKNFGLDGFEVVDNGTGIKAEDYASVALKHHTSKLEDFHDLTQVTTFGFRGEALSSLCAHANVTILTATKEEAPMGTLLQFGQDGRLADSSKKMARQRGCTVTVSGLFHSLPVRRRELEKHSKREYGKVQSLLQAYALISKGVRWSVVNTSKEGRKTVALAISSANTDDWLYRNYASVFGAKSTVGLRDLDLQMSIEDDGPAKGSGSGKRRIGEAIKAAASRRVANKRRKGDGDEEDIIPTPGSDAEDLDDDDDDDVAVSPRASSSPEPSATQTLLISGLISLPTKASGRTTSDRQFFYINGRPWDNIKISRTCNEVFRSFNHTTSTAVPVVIADFRLKTYEYDVNVSPDKRTIFIHREAVLVEKFKAALEELYAPSRGTFAVNGSTASQHQSSQFTQTMLGYKTSARGSSQQSQQLQSEGSGEEDENLQAERNPPSEDHNASQEADSQDDETAATERVDPPEVNGSDDEIDNRSQPQPRQSESLFLHDDEEVLSEDEVLRSPVPEHTTASPSSSAALMPPPAQPRHSNGVRASPAAVPMPAFVSSRTTTSTQRRRTSPSAPIAPTATARSSRSSRRSRSPVASRSIASMLTGFARPGSGVTASQVVADDDGEDEDEEDVRRHDEPLDDEDMDNGHCHGHGHGHGHGHSHDHHDAVVDDEGEEEEEHDDDASRLRSKHVSLHPSSDVDTAEEERETNLQALDTGRNEYQSGSDEADEGSITVEKRTAQADSVLIDMALLRRNSQKAVTQANHADSDDSDDDLLYVDPGEVAAATERHANRDALSSAGLSNMNDAAVTLSLQRVITQEDFAKMEILGQFNLGFIIVRRRAGDSKTKSKGDDGEDDLFIVDQHASDEKFNFETLQSQTKIRSQKLISPRPLELSATDELVAQQHIDTIRSNGFDISIDESALAGSRVKLVSQPVSKGTVFGIQDLEELLYLLRGTSPNSAKAQATRCSKARAMFASRACRKSVMIGTALNQRQMASIVRHMGEIEQPWNCPHGRPTMRHLTCLKSGTGQRKGRNIDWEAVLRL